MPHPPPARREAHPTAASIPPTPGSAGREGWPSGGRPATRPRRHAPPDGLREHLEAAFGGAYAIGRELGGGGMSRVFAAEEVALGRLVAIKVLAPEVSSSVDTDRFRQEVHVAARLQHPNIVPLLTAGEVDGMLYYTMPFISGESLRARMVRSTLLSIDVVQSVVRDVAKALGSAHRHGVVHRDVKPENVLLHEGGDAMVADFGIAKALSASTSGVHTAAGFMLGTPGYIAPEQVACDPAADHRADLYSLGMIAYEMLAGAHPFAGRSAKAVLTAHLIEMPMTVGLRRHDVPPRLSGLVMHLLAKHPDDRPGSAEDILRALDVRRCPRPDPVPARIPTPTSAWQHALSALTSHPARRQTTGADAAGVERGSSETGEATGARETLGGRLQHFLTASFRAHGGRHS